MLNDGDWLRPFGIALTLIYIGAQPAASEEAPFDLNDQAVIAKGREAFASTCVYCHGDQGSGGRAGPLRGRTDFTPNYVFSTITNGKRVGSFNMPAWKDSLDEATRWQLTAYILSLRTAK